MTLYLLREVWPYEYDMVLGVYSSMEALEAARVAYAAGHTSLSYVEFEVSTVQLDAAAEWHA
jgi:hypothetical protein